MIVHSFQANLKLKHEVVNVNYYKTGAINDPLGQPTVPAGSDCRWILKFCAGRTDGRTTCVKIVITTGRDCGRPRGSIFLAHSNSIALR